jgi:uncharacterized membrane protein
MSSPEADDFDPEAPEEREIGREMIDQSTGLGSVMAHLYRGEMDRVTMWRQRMDESTKWAVTVISAVLVYAFSSSGTSPAILLAGIVVTVVFLVIEARRYRDYDVYRSRARMIEENLFANALDPTAGVEHHDWREELSEDYRNPKMKIPAREALRRRLRRIYLPLLAVLLVAWIFRITALSSGPIIEAAAIGSIPGLAVIAVVGVFYLGTVVLTFVPQNRRAKGERTETDLGEWKGGD